MASSLPCTLQHCMETGVQWIAWSDTDATKAWGKEKLHSMISDCSPDNVHNEDKTGIFYQLLPDKTMRFNCDTCKGGKRSKVCVTAFFCGIWHHKMELLVIGIAGNGNKKWTFCLNRLSLLWFIVAIAGIRRSFSLVNSFLQSVQVHCSCLSVLNQEWTLIVEPKSKLDQWTFWFSSPDLLYRGKKHTVPFTHPFATITINGSI